MGKISRQQDFSQYFESNFSENNWINFRKHFWSIIEKNRISLKIFLKVESVRNFLIFLKNLDNFSKHFGSCEIFDMCFKTKFAKILFGKFQHKIAIKIMKRSFLKIRAKQSNSILGKFQQFFRKISRNLKLFLLKNWITPLVRLVGWILRKIVIFFSKLLLKNQNISRKTLDFLQASITNGYFTSFNWVREMVCVFAYRKLAQTTTIHRKYCKIVDNIF